MQGLCESAAQPSAVRLLGWLVSWRVYTAMVSGCWSTSGSTRLEPGPGPERERERENLRPITLSISNGAFPRLMSTRALSTYTQSTRSHARRDRGRGRETERE